MSRVICRRGPQLTLASILGLSLLLPGCTESTSTGPTATQLAFLTPPANAAAGALLNAVEVVIQDAQGNTVTSDSVSVTLAIGTNPASGTLSGTTTVAAVSGVATFTNLHIDKAGTGYTLAASGGGLTGATSPAFNVTAGSPANLAFSVQPTAATAGAAISPAVRVAVQDSLGNTVTSSSASIAVAISSGTGTAGAHLRGTTTVSATSGVATFSGLSIDSAATGYTLAAAAAGLSGATSMAFNIAAGAASQLVFTTQPLTSMEGTAFGAGVTALDVQGNAATTFTGNVTVALTGGTGTAGAVLGGTLTQAAVSGVATFSDLTVNQSGTGYTLTTTAPGLTSAASAAFAVTAPMSNDNALEVTGGGTGSGTVWSNQGNINCTIASGAATGPCEDVYFWGSLVTLTAQATSGSVFAGWSGACTGTGACAVLMVQYQSVTATFNVAPSGAGRSR